MSLLMSTMPPLPTPTTLPAMPSAFPAPLALPWTCTLAPDGSLLHGYYFDVPAGPAGPTHQVHPAHHGLAVQAPLHWNQEAERLGVRRKVLCTSAFAVQHPEPALLAGPAAQPTRCQPLLPLIKATPWLDWLILTSFPRSFKKYAPVEGYPSNLWLGTSISCQEDADERLFHLLSAPASVRFIVCDPLVEQICLRTVQHEMLVELDAFTGRHGVVRPLAGRSSHRLDWVIIGGEFSTIRLTTPFTTPTEDLAQTSQINAIRHLVQQCKSAHCPVFVSQAGNDGNGNAGNIGTAHIDEFPQQIPVFESTSGGHHASY